MGFMRISDPGIILNSSVPMSAGHPLKYEQLKNDGNRKKPLP